MGCPGNPLPGRSIPWPCGSGRCAVKWYGLAYVAGLLLGCAITSSACCGRTGCGRASKRPLAPGQGRRSPALHDGRRAARRPPRLRAVLRAAATSCTNPLEIAAVWKGGMAFHGGAARPRSSPSCCSRGRVGTDPWSVMDRAAAATPIGLFFGRLANFINAELVGPRRRTVPWAMVFPGRGPLPRHPSQLYEALHRGPRAVCRAVVARASQAWRCARPG